MSIKSNSQVENDETTEKGMFQQMIENVDMYGTKHALQNQKGEKVQKSRLGGIISIFTYVLLALAFYLKVDMIMNQGVTQTLDSNKRNL